MLKKHWPNVRRFENVRECGRLNLPPVDIISGGFPCQDESSAGKKRGLGTPDNPTGRSGLWFEYNRIIHELRPRWVLIENVSRLLRAADGDTVLSGMEEIGYACWPLMVGAENLGAPHPRERAWIICHRNDAHGRSDFGAAMAGEWSLPAQCQQKMEEAKERWDYWKHELSRGPGHGFSPMISTPTATEILEAGWPSDGRFYQTDSGRMRKRCKNGTDRGMSWVLEMAARAVKQDNPNLRPTPEACEEFMGFRRGWTDLGGEGPEAVAYARILRGVRGIPNWVDRLKALV